MYDSFVFDKKTFPFKRTSPFKRIDLNRLKLIVEELPTLAFRGNLLLLYSHLGFPLKFHSKKCELIEGMVKSRHRSRKKVRLPVACCDDCPSNARGKRGKRARFEKQDVADERENFARDNYKYEAEKDVR